MRSFFFLLPLLVFSMATAMDMIEETCKESSEQDPNIDYTFCVNSFRSIPDIEDASLNTLGLISISLAKTNMTCTKSSIEDLLKTQSVDAKTESGLKDCLELYSDSISTLDEAAEDYVAHRFSDANVKVSSVMESTTSCQDGFLDFEVISPLTQHNQDVFHLCAITLSITKMLSFYVSF